MRPQDFKRNTFMDVLNKKSVKKIDFVDVPISDKVTLGSFETMGSQGGYHYQAYNNIFHFLTLPNLKSGV